MTAFATWGPNAHRVEVVLGNRRVPMRRDDSGWHRCEINARAGDDYAFSLDGGPPRPDPRSAHQPQGIDGPSRLVDHSAFPWTDDRWRPPPLAASVLYEVHVGTFTPEGTFRSAIDRLDHLVDVGVTAVEVMPVAQFPGTRGWGYDGVDLYAPHESYGGPHQLKAFIDACHRRGLAVVMDVVYNHLGPVGNYLSEFGPYFTDKYATPWGDGVNFDGPGSDEVRSFFIDNTLMWLRDYHCDGVRIDAVHAILDSSAIHFLQELTARVRELESQLDRKFWVIAESDLNHPRVVRPVDEGGYGLDAQWSDDFHHSLHALLTGERTGYYVDFGGVTDVAAALTKGFVYDGRYSSYRRRRHGAPTTGLSGNRFLGYLQNHDQVGNRAVGDRISALVSHELLKVGAALVLASPFVPMLFMGEEWGATSPFLYFTDHGDEALGRAVREGRRSEFAAFGWDPKEIPDPQDPATFARSKLDWGELDKEDHANLLDWHRRLIRMRKETPALIDGRLDLVRTRQGGTDRWLVVERGPVTVACNFSPAPVDVPVAVDRRGGLLLASGADPNPAGDLVELAPESVAIYSA